MKKTKRGVTLVEIAIVLVIIGLLLGGVLKGQELINNAKVRSISDRQNSLKAAWFAFIDRYSALPGDYVAAAQYIPGAVNGTGDGTLDENESPLVLSHLASAGYIRCSQCKAQLAEDPSAKNSLTNSYGGVMAIFHHGANYSYRSAAAALATNRPLFIFSGNRLPSNIVAEVDRKIDDGTANEGDFTFSDYRAAGAGGADPSIGECMSQKNDVQQNAAQIYAAGPLYWRIATASPAVDANCGAANRI